MPTETVLDYSGLDPRVTYNNGVRLNPTLIAWLNRYRATVPADIPIHVNSGERTPEEQGAAMFKKYQEAERQHAEDVAAGKAKPRRDGAAELRAIYGAKIEQFFQVPQWDWPELITSLATRGILVSPHQDGRAVDIRTRDRSDSDIATLIDAAAKLGAKPLREYAPPHLHVGSITAASVAQSASVGPVARVQGAGGGPGVLGVALLLAAVGAALTGGSDST